MGDERAADVRARRAVDAYADMILRLSYTYLRSTQDAEDICQTVLLKLLTGAQRFESVEHEKAWVIRTTANACKDELRRAGRTRTVELDAAAQAAAPEPPESVVLDRVMQLPEKYREALYLHYYEGYSAREIARICGRSESAVLSHLSRGRAKLRAELEGVCDEQGVWTRDGRAGVHGGREGSSCPHPHRCG